MDVDAELDRLYSVSLEDFIQERDAIGRAAKDAGDGDAATRVKKLAKPSVAAWTINQLARRHSDEIGELLAIRDELEAAQSSEQLRTLAGRRRDVVARLTRSARQILEDAGHSASHATVEKVSQGLLAGGSEEERDLLKRGRLTREPTASGLDAFGMAAAEEPAESSPRVPLKTQREIDRLRREAERLQHEAARLAQEADFADEQARRARSKAEEAADAADAALAQAHEAAESAGLR